MSSDVSSSVTEEFTKRLPKIEVCFKTVILQKKKNVTFALNILARVISASYIDFHTDFLDKVTCPSQRQHNSPMPP